ncbi:unnamed protein product, partial [Tenebrio molitor]
MEANELNPSLKSVGFQHNCSNCKPILIALKGRYNFQEASCEVPHLKEYHRFQRFCLHSWGNVIVPMR